MDDHDPDYPPQPSDNTESDSGQSATPPALDSTDDLEALDLPSAPVNEPNEPTPPVPPKVDSPKDTFTLDQKHPLTFVPILYFMQALPIAMVQELATIMYKGVGGVPDDQLLTWTSLLALPWSFKMLWGPLVELTHTKKKWLLGMQALITVGIVAYAISFQLPNPFGIGIALLMMIAMFSATCDIATDGFYLLTVKCEEQPKYVGWQSTFFRLGRLFVNAALLTLAGWLSRNGTSTPASYTLVLAVLAGIYFAGRVAAGFLLPTPPADEQRAVSGEEIRPIVGRTLAAIGFGAGLFTLLGATFRFTGNLIAPNLFVLPVTSVKLLGVLPIATDVAGPAAEGLRMVIGLIAMGVFGFLLSTFAKGTEFARSFGTFFKQRFILAILLFMTFYRFGEAMLGRLVPLFLKDGTTADAANPNDKTTGLGFADEQIGLVNGTFGVIGIVIGGIVGGYFVAKMGLRKSFIALALAMNIPNLMYVWAAYNNPNPGIMSGIMFFDQFGYGFGFAGYLSALMLIAQRNPQYRTAHYAIGTGLGALIISMAGIVSAQMVNFMNFGPIFTSILILTVPCLLTMLLLPKEVLEATGVQVEQTDID